MNLPSSASRALSALAVLLVCTQPSVARDDPPADPVPKRSTAPAVDKLGVARGLIAAKQWSAALDELKRVNDVGSADWNNLMGYTSRKSKTPDLAAAQRYYDEALRIDPRHRNALEYSGELYLMKGELAQAEGRLGALNAECAAAPCEQQADLKAAIERYKAAGNKYVPADRW